LGNDVYLALFVCYTLYRKQCKIKVFIEYAGE
jgi:hypothetical protein